MLDKCIKICYNIVLKNNSLSGTNHYKKVYGGLYINGYYGLN